MYIKTSVSVHQLAANISPTNFASPEEFVPDRWVDCPPEAFKSDKLNAMNPFSVGPRNCIGQVRPIISTVFGWEALGNNWTNGCNFYSILHGLKCALYSLAYFGILISSCAKRVKGGSRGRRCLFYGINRIWWLNWAGKENWKSKDIDKNSMPEGGNFIFWRDKSWTKRGKFSREA